MNWVLIYNNSEWERESWWDYRSKDILFVNFQIESLGRGRKDKILKFFSLEIDKELLEGICRLSVCVCVLGEEQILNNISKQIESMSFTSLSCFSLLPPLSLSLLSVLSFQQTYGIPAAGPHHPPTPNPYPLPKQLFIYLFYK